MRIVWPCVSLTSTPRASRRSAISRPVPTAGSMSIPAQRPATRMPVTPWPTSSASFASRCSPRAAARVWNSPGLEHLDDPQSDGGRERVAAERRAVLAGTDDPEDVLVRDDGREGQDAAAQRLAEQVHVGHDALAVAREGRADAAETRLDLVGDEEDVVPRADLAHRREVALRRDDDARLALDRLEEHGGGLGRDGGLDRSGVAVRHRDEPGRERAEVGARLRVVAEAHDRGRAAVEVAVRDDDGRGIRSHALDPVRPRARDLDAGLDRFGARVHREDEVLLAQPRERLGERREAVVVEGAAREREPAELLGRGGDESRMPVPEVERRVRRQQVEVALALDIGHPRALAARDDDGKRVVVAGDVLVVGSDDADRRRVEHGGLRGGHGEFLQLRSSRVQHLMPPPPRSSSDRSTSIGL